MPLGVSEGLGNLVFKLGKETAYGVKIKVSFLFLAVCMVGNAADVVSDLAEGKLKLTHLLRVGKDVLPVEVSEYGFAGKGGELHAVAVGFLLEAGIVIRVEREFESFSFGA